MPSLTLSYSKLIVIVNRSLHLLGSDAFLAPTQILRAGGINRQPSALLCRFSLLQGQLFFDYGIYLIHIDFN